MGKVKQIVVGLNYIFKFLVLVGVFEFGVLNISSSSHLTVAFIFGILITKIIELELKGRL